MPIQSVSEITYYIRDLFAFDETLKDVWIKGEVSNMRPASSGHWYFTLKDQEAQIRCVMWRSAASRQSVVPQDGDELEVHGSISVYEVRGEYQLYADLIRPVGVGDLYQQFERLKAQLAVEGLFDADRKREAPEFPLKIGVVTSPTAAAFQDILNVLSRRFPIAEVVLSPTLVQGGEAAGQIVRAIGRLNAYSDVDVIILSRGGGSIEDLWPFNDEFVARTVADSRIPVITGVGHDTDFTIVDFVSDARAPTPSAAAELATPDIAEWRETLMELDADLISIIGEYLNNKRERIRVVDRNLQHVSPVQFIRNSRQRVDDLQGRVGQLGRSHLNLLRERLQSRISALNAANPDAILSRGYAIVTESESGKRIISELDAEPGTGITIQLKDGQLKARIEDKETHGLYRRTLF